MQRRLGRALLRGVHRVVDARADGRANANQLFLREGDASVRDLEQLRAEVLLTKQPGPETGVKPKGRIYDNPWTFQLARRKCKHCEAKPAVADIGGTGPGEHWDVHCPQRP